MTSDEFFSNLNINIKYDTIFIDGLHECHQVTRDFTNSLKHSNEGSIIIFDDVYPFNEYEQIIPVNTVYGASTGDVWKLIYHILPILKSLEVDIYFFKDLHFHVRGMFAIVVNKNLINNINKFEFDGNNISNIYSYKNDFLTYSQLLI